MLTSKRYIKFECYYRCPDMLYNMLHRKNEQICYNVEEENRIKTGLKQILLSIYSSQLPALLFSIVAPDSGSTVLCCIFDNYTIEYRQS